MSERDLAAARSFLSIVLAALCTLSIMAALAAAWSLSWWAIVFAVSAFACYELYVTLTGA